MERLTSDLATRWCRSGHEVVCFTTPLPSGPSPELTRAGVLVRPLSGVPGRYSREWRRAVRAAVNPEDYDVIVGVSSGAASLVRPARAPGAPILMQAHGTALAEIVSKLRTPSLRSILGAVRNTKNVIEDWARYPRYDAIVAVSRGVARDLTRVPRWARARRIITVPNGVEVPRRPTDSRSPRPQPRVVFAGRLVREKGADLLLRASVGRSWRVEIIGGGRAGRRLGRLAERLGIAERVDFTGPIERPQVVARIEAADVVVVPSRRREGLPLVVLEAMAAGRRVIVSRQISSTEPGLLPDGSVLESTSPGSVRRAVDRALGDPSPIPPLPEAYDIDVCANTYLALFAELTRSDRVASAR